MKLRVALILVAFFFPSWCPTGAFAGELSLEKGVICLDVRDRLPVGEAREFPPSTAKVYCYTVIAGAKGPAHVTHVWYYRGKKMREMILPVNSIRWRTWSNKNILPGQTGPWAVDIVDTARQKVIGTVHFRIQ
ncbi:MAG: DUF2914 domain-containing protein [Deltaproteobacteria bacterium]|nr:DUF2914 domain-containing protein [Deltaproteobacteria bacterium]